jgi:hypothetical protein
MHRETGASETSFSDRRGTRVEPAKPLRPTVPGAVWATRAKRGHAHNKPVGKL